MANPRMCPHCRAFIDPKARVCEYCGNEIAKAVPVRPEGPSVLSSLLPQAQSTTSLILFINFAIFAATLIMTFKVSSESPGLFAGIDGGVLRLFGAKDAYFIARGDWWRLVTAGFLHAGLFHILMNSWVIFDLGSRVEEIFGTSRFVVLYVLSSIGGFIVSLWWSPLSLSIGASAAACGLIGAMLAYARLTGSSMLWSFYMRWIIMIAIIGLLPGFHIDNAAHFGGLATGFVVAYAAGTPRFSSALEPLWKVAAGFTVAIVAVSFFLAYQSLSLVLRELTP